MKFDDLFNSIFNECTSVGTEIGGDVILAKNRDRTYYPKVKLVRELINGIEVAYMYDIDTDYAEGMNAAGIGIVNTTLQGKKDEEEGHKGEKDKAKEKGKTKIKHKRLSEDGYKIRKALGYTNVRDIVKILDLYHRGLGGHTTIGTPKGFVSIEKLHFGKPRIHVHPPEDIIVRTNHGIDYPDQGYQYGDDRESSLSREFLATKEANRTVEPNDLLVNLRRHHDHVPGFLEPYRTNYHVWTSTQIMMNLSRLELTFVIDENAKFEGIENKLPRDYMPKIKIKVERLETMFKVRPSVKQG